MTVESNKETVRRFVEALDTNELSVVSEVCTPECAQIWQYGINIGPWSDHHISTADLIGEGDIVMATAETRGRVVGDFFGIDGGGTPFTNRGAALYRFSDGKIASVELYFNDLPIALQTLGGHLVRSDS